MTTTRAAAWLPKPWLTRDDFVGNPVKTGNPTFRRFNGYADTVAAAGLTVHTARSAFYESPATKARELRELLTSGRKIDGVFCSDDLTSILLLKEARKLGIRVPEDLKIVGFDGTQLVQNYVPELATVVQPVPELAGTLVKLDRGPGKETGPKQLLAPGQAAEKPDCLSISCGGGFFCLCQDNLYFSRKALIIKLGSNF